MRRATLALWAALVIAGPVAPPSIAAQAVAEQQDDSLYERVMAAIIAGQAETVLPELASAAAAARKSGDDNAEGLVVGLRANALLSAGRREDARKAFDLSAQLTKEQGFPNYLRFLISVDKKEWQDASTALDRLVGYYPDIVRTIEPRSVYFYFAENKGTSEDHLDDQRIGLAEIGYAGADGVFLTLNAIAVLMKRGEAARAAELTPFVDDVRRLQEALVDRKYEPLWPAFERNAGERSALAAASHIRRTKSAADENPEDKSRLSNLVSALSTAGQTEEALAIGAKVGATPTELAALVEDLAWVVNEHALALHRAGKKAEAERRYSELIAANSSKPWIVNMVINRLELLVQDGNNAAADGLLSHAEAAAATFGNPYARQLVRRLKLCNAVALGKNDAVSALVADLHKHAADAEAATIEGLLCAGDLDGAETIALKQFADPEKVTAVLASLQRKPLSRDDPSLWTTNWAKLRTRPAIEAAFAKAGRDLPDRFYVTPSP